jgi:hypothetical protein
MKRVLWFPFVCLSSLFVSTRASAEVLHHWRFAPGTEFLGDSVMGGASLASSDDNPARPSFMQFHLPSQGTGEYFPASFGQLSSNEGAIDFIRPFPGGSTSAGNSRRRK